MAGMEVTAGDWPLGGRLFLLSEDKLACASLVIFLLTGSVRFRSLSQSDQDI